MAENTRPIAVDPDRLVQNVYQGPDSRPDLGSQNEYSEYLTGRMYGFDDPVTRKFTPGSEVPGSTRLVFDGCTGLKTALALTVASTVALNLYNGAYKSIGGKIGEIAGDIAAEVHPTMVPQLSRPSVVESGTTTTSYPIDISGKEQRSGVAESSKLPAKDLVRKLGQLTYGDKIVSITIQGSASDEWTGNGPKSLGRPDAENKKLASNRATNFADQVEKTAEKSHIDIPDVKVASAEQVLGDTQLSDLLLGVQKSKYGSVLEAITAYNNHDDSMSPKLQAQIKQSIGKKRDSIAVITVQNTATKPGEIRYTPQPDAEKSRKDSKHPFKLPFLIIPPLPRFRRIKEEPFSLPPKVVEKPLDKAWIELYPKALGKGNRLVDNAWSLSRKYQYLYRDERITQALRFDYQDDDGKDQNINVIFADREELTPETIEVVSSLMLQISMMQRGKVAENLDTIAIFPSEHTGAQRPDKIGLGIDEQYGKSTLGVAIPAIGLVEIQLPKKPKAKDIDSFTGLSWTLAHEVAGHFTDVASDTARKVKPRASNRPGRSFNAGNAFIGVGGDSYATTGRRKEVQVQQFAIPHPDGTELEFVVNANDARMKTAEEVRLRGQSPTRYGDQDELEIHAETAAAVLTGLPIPPKESGRLANGALGDKTGYSVDRGLEERFARLIGAQPNSDSGLTWDDAALKSRQETFKMSVLRGQAEVNDDADQNDMSEGAKAQPYLPDEERLKIFAGITD